jgi:NitT/TauT family transport system ATP-binding protein
MRPRIILMDEPFAALDALTRRRMQEELLRLWEEVGFTMLFVTHSISEAIRVGSRVIVLSPRPARVRAELNIEAGEQLDEADDRFRGLHERIERTLFKGAPEYSI